MSREPICIAPHELLPFSFSPDSSRLAVRWSQGVQFFDIADGRQAPGVEVAGQVVSAALSPVGDTLALALNDNSIQIVQIADGTVLHTLEGHTEPALHLLFSPFGAELFSASHDGTLRTWDTQTGTQRSLMQVGLGAGGIGVSPDGSTLAVVLGDGPVQLWNVASGELVKSLGGTGGYDTSNPVFSPDGLYLAVDLAAGLDIWSLADGREIRTNFANSMAIAYSPNGGYLSYSDIDQGNKVLLGSSDAQGEFSVIDQMSSPVWELFFSPDSSLLAATDGVEIRIWSIPEGRRVLVGASACPATNPSPG